ncbi:MAG: hypothetical protein KGH63_03810 [Candidatus Micrarchaeota archaeon]|nr:hypothetical protein [Candidatus Micrarchaeota archaeon]
MWDLVRFSPALQPGAENEQARYIDVRSAGANFFSSAASLEQGRSAAKRAQYLHFPSYEADIGLVRALKENECTLLIAVSDFLDGGQTQVAQKLGRARQLVFLALHFDCGVRVVTLAREEMELRSEHELMAIGLLLGFSEQQMRAQLKEPAPVVGARK